MRRSGMTWMLTFGWLAVVALSGCESLMRSDAIGQSKPVNVLETRNGSDPALNEGGQWVINSYDEAHSIGSPQLDSLNVDFESESLVLVTLGEQPTGGIWIKIDGVSAQGRELYVYGVANRPGSNDATVQMLTYPFAAAVIPKTSADVLHIEFASVEGQDPS